MLALLETNLSNLHAFWYAMSRNKRENVNLHTGWPNKIWHSDFSKIESDNWQDRVHVTIEQPLEQEEVYIKTQLTAMHLVLENATGKVDKNISSIDSFSKLDIWADACSLAFGYDINTTSLVPLLEDENATILAFQVNGQIAGTAILYQNNNNIGVHQVGVLPSFQKRGIGKTIMLHIMAVSKQKACKTMTLQASQTGLPMYLNLGFIPLADIFYLEKSSTS